MRPACRSRPGMGRLPTAAVLAFFRAAVLLPPALECNLRRKLVTTDCALFSTVDCAHPPRHLAAGMASARCCRP